MVAAKSVVMMFLFQQSSPAITATDTAFSKAPTDHLTDPTEGSSLLLSKRISVSEWEAKPSAPWGRILGLPCSISVPTLARAGDYADYYPDWGGAAV